MAFHNIGSEGGVIGSCHLKDSGLEFKDTKGNSKEYAAADIKDMLWNVYGQRGYLKVSLNNGDWTRFDGFEKTDFDTVSELCKTKFKKHLSLESVSSEGASFGDLTLRNTTVMLQSLSSEKTIFEMKIDNAAQAVVPTTTAAKNDLEIQFPENDEVSKDVESLVQITLHFPPPAVDEAGNVEELSPAAAFQAEIMKTGVIKNIKGDVICEFSNQVGKFVSPRGNYAMQMTSTYLHMQGAQYTYKIKYSDITSLFLLDKPGSERMAFVICLSLPIRQGAQKYQALVLETHKLEHTINLNLTQEEIDANPSYAGQLQPEMRLSMSSCVAKIFKVLTETPVFVPKAFKSFREDFCVRCTVKTQDGLLYPLAKNIIFINKPTIIVAYEDIEYVEFQRYVPTANSATKNFDLVMVTKASMGGKGKAAQGESYLFSSIERSEYTFLFDYMESKKVNILNPQKGLPTEKGSRAAGAFAGMDLGSDADEDEESDDGDYAAGESSESSRDSDDSGTDQSGDEGEDKPKKEKKEKKVPGEKRVRGPTKPRAPKEPKEKKAPGKKKKKDKDAPKGARGAYILFTSAMRATVVEENPTLKVTEVMKELAERWKKLDDAAKEPFNEQARADKERYNQEMVAYKQKKALSGADLDSDDDMDIE
jgi:structure-specific recognition protein 1